MSLKKKIYIGAIGLTLINLLITVNLTAQFAGGSGTAEDPWQVETVAHLNNIRNYLGREHNNKHFIQIANIDLGFPPWNEGEGWQPIGGIEERDRFTGNFDGNNFLISNLVIFREAGNYQGLFAYIEEAILKNIVLENVAITANRYIGSLTAYQNNSQIINCGVSGTVIGLYPMSIIDPGAYIGGLVGYKRFGEGQSNIIIDSYSTANVSGDMYIGGLVGHNWDGDIVSCRAEGKIRGSAFLGGIAGASNNLIKESYANSSVIGKNSAIGGLTGTSSGQIINCYAAGYTQGETYTAGLVGINSGIVRNSYSVGKVIGGSENMGGLIASNNGEVINSYWNIETSTQESSAGGDGRSTLQLINMNAFQEWDFEVSWAINDGFSYPWLSWQPDLEKQNIPGPRNFTATGGNEIIHLSWIAPVMAVEPIGYNIYRDGDRVNQQPVVMTQYNDEGLNNWQLYEYYVSAVYELGESSYAVQRSAPVLFAGGLGTEDEPFLIETAEQLNGVRFLLSSYFLQISNIDLGVAPWNEGEGWHPIGSFDYNDRFNGFYDGNGYNISNLNINREEGFYQGLFAYTQNAHLKNIRLENVDITASRYIGGLVGYQNNTRIENCSTGGVIVSIDGLSYLGGLVGNQRYGDADSNAIINSYSTADVTGGSYTGGLIGDSWNGDIISCWADGNVSGQMFTGGLIGYARQNSIRQSYAKGNVTGTQTSTGGLVGYATGIIVNCYAMGDVRGTNRIGGLAGNNLGTIRNSYSTGVVDGGFTNIGGLIGSNSGLVENCYWDIETSQRENSAGGEGRLTRQMVYPYEFDSTYLDWDFEQYWVEDYTYNVNDGYPYLHYQEIEPGDNPNVATNPQPHNRAVDVPLILEELAWTYEESPLYTNPVGFRVYMNQTGEFGETDEFVWVAFIENQENYSSSEIITELISGNTYHWKVVPTTIDPNDRSDRRSINLNDKTSQRHNPSIRGDAEDVPIWSFTMIEINPNPVTAVNPYPEDLEIGISTELDKVSWDYVVNELHINPVGFRVYLNTSGVFDENDEFVWIDYNDDEVRFSSSEVLPDTLEENAVYFWKVVATTIKPERGSERRLTAERTGLGAARKYRGDAENVPIWRFTTASSNLDEDIIIPMHTSLHGNYPNPFNPNTAIVFSVAMGGRVVLEVFDIRGRKISTLTDKNLPAGEYRIIWDGRDKDNNEVGSGIYLYRINVFERGTNFSAIKKAIMVR